MDKITHEVRLANWKNTVEQCNDRPQGMTVKQWLAENNINEKTYYYWLRRVRREMYARMNTELAAAKVQTQKPSVVFAEIPIIEQSDQTVAAFKADAMIRSGPMVIEISNSISDSLLSRILEVASHAL